MNYEHKSNLENALKSQTWNKSLVKDLVNAIEESLKRPKSINKKSLLQIAIETEKDKKLKSGPDISNSSEEE